METKKLLSFFPILLICLAIFMLNITFAGKISGTILMIIRIVLIGLFFTAWQLFKRKKQIHAKNLAFIFMVINLAFFIVSFFTIELWNLNLNSAKGIALMKFSDGFIISFVLIGSFLVGGYKLNDIFISRGRLTLGLSIGFLTFILFGLYALLSSKQPIESAFISKNLGWILLFIFSNAFMEELLFRGIFIKALNNFLKPVWTIILTAIVFAAAHLQVTYTPDVLFLALIVLILGVIWGFLIHYTKSIIASVLFHAGGDLLIIVPTYLSLAGNG